MALKSSLRLSMLLVTVHMIAACVVAETLIPVSTRVATIILIFVSLSYHLARDALLLLPDSWREISYQQGRLSVVSQGGMHLSGPLAGRAAVTPHFLVIGVRPEGCRLPVFRLIFPDSLDAGTFRELCVRLKFSQ